MENLEFVIMQQVILVDKNDNEIGFASKLEAHQKGLLHRAFSVFIFDNDNKLLLQKRAHNKYHSPNLLSNTCCSHPQPHESVLAAGNRRLMEEMGIVADLQQIGFFVYRTAFENGLIEYEYDHILFGKTNLQPQINREEVSEWKKVTIEELIADIKVNSHNYTEWLKIFVNSHLSILLPYIK